MFNALLLTLAAVAGAEEYLPAGATVDDAASVQLTERGLNAVAGMAGGLVPGEFDIPDQGESLGSCFNFSFTEGWAGLQLDDLRIVPATGELELQADLQVWLNDASDKFKFKYSLFCANGNCPGYVTPFPVWVTAPISLAVTTDAFGEPFLDATVGEIVVNHGLNTSHIKLDGSGCLQNVEAILDYLGLSIYDFLIDQITPFLQDMVQDYRADIEEQIESAFAAARFSDTVDVAGIPLSIDLYPRDVIITPKGVEVIAGGKMSAPADTCTAGYGVPGSLRTPSPTPDIGASPPGSEAILHLSDEIANQGLYALWSGGLLCYTISEESDDIDLPIPVDTTLLGIVAGDHFKEIIGEGKQPIVIKTAPYEPPRVSYTGDHDVEIQVRELDLDFYTDIEFRQARAIGITITADAGIDVTFDGATGRADVAIDLGEGAIVGEATHVELTPSAKAEIEANFQGLLGTLMGQLLGGALDDMSFMFPSSDGMGLTSLDLQPTGAGDWLGGYATIGEVTYSAGEDDGCGGGCQTGGSGAPWLAGLALIAARRRGRRA